MVGAGYLSAPGGKPAIPKQGGIAQFIALSSWLAQTKFRLPTPVISGNEFF
jgi:hypothetical protein